MIPRGAAPAGVLGAIARLLIVLLVMPQAAKSAEQRFFVGASGAYATVDGVANADPTRLPSQGESPLPPIPDALSIDGLLFDDDDFAWSAFAGWRVWRFLAVEAGYADLGEFRRSPRVGAPEEPRIAIEEWYLAARLEMSIGKGFSAHWLLGVTQDSFDVSGRQAIGFLDVPVIVVVPLASPRDETGFLWGLGITYALTDRLGLGLAYRKHATDVIDAETIGLEAVYGF